MSRRKFTKDWWMSLDLHTDDFDGAACASKEHRNESDIWTADPKEVGSSEARRLRDRAVTICVNECPALMNCARYALSHTDLVGVWGGMDDDDRKKVRRRITANMPA